MRGVPRRRELHRERQEHLRSHYPQLRRMRVELRLFVSASSRAPLLRHDTDLHVQPSRLSLNGDFMRFSVLLYLGSVAFTAVACGSDSSEGKKAQPSTDAAPDSTGLGFGGSSGGGGIASTGGAAGEAGSFATTGGTTAATGGSAPQSSGGAATGGQGAVTDAAAGGASPEGGADAGRCASDADCRAPNRFCDLAHGVCVECLSDNHCPQGETCALSNHVCKFACTTSADCKDPRPYCDTLRSECVECLGDTNCSTGNKRVCESKTRTCVECTANSDCVCLLLGQAPCCTATNTCTCGLLVCL